MVRNVFSRAALPVLALASLLGGCQTVKPVSDEPSSDVSFAEAALADTAPADAPVDTDQPAADKPAADKPADKALDISEPASGAEEDDGKRYALGALEDDDVRQALYKTLAAKLTKAAGTGDEASTELGDLDTFKFTVMKLMNGRFDVSAAGKVAADAMDVQVTGWYKRIVRTTTDGDTKPACSSFDALVSVARRGSDWHLAPGTEPQIGREDAEDCF